MKQATANTFGALGYSSVLIQWFWVLLVLGLPIFTSDLSKQLFLPAKPASRSAPELSFSLPSSIEIVISVLALLFVTGAIVYALVVAPRVIGRSGQQVTQRSARVVLSHIKPRQPISRKQRRRLRERINWSIKLGLILAPIGLQLIPPGPSLGLSHSITFVTGLVFGVVSLLLFAVQLMLVKIWRIPNKQVW